MANKNPEPGCGADVRNAIHQAYPGNIVTEDVLYAERSYYDDIRDQVRAALCGIKDAGLAYDRPPEGRPHWEESADPEEDPPSWAENSSSYDLLFLALHGEQFEFEGELEEDVFSEDVGDVITVTVPAAGKIGCAIGISTIGPFAVVRFTEMESAESGSCTIPDIGVHMFDLDGTELDIEAHYKELFLEEGVAALRDLRKEITRVLGAFDIRVLSEQELRTKMPELRSELLWDAEPGKTAVTVEDALFLQTV